ncbi:conserved domain protein [Ruminococcus sp. CAG:579]|nr:conserved domain protein [Ruminococcus sp. CAG:579]
MQPEKTRIRQKRLQIQQGVISIACLALIVFVFSWLINTAVTGRKHGLLPASAGKSSSSQAEVTMKKKNTSSAASSSAAESKADTSSQDNSSADDSAAVYDGAAMKDDFSDACFIGDSRTLGLGLNCDKAKADFYASQGLNISSALTDQVIELQNGNMGTVLEAAAQKEYKRIFVMFGINELGWPYPENFVEKYEELIEGIKAAQPNASIYVQSILPVAASAVNNDAVFTNENINAFNAYVEQAANETGVNYLDINGYFKDDSGMLPEDAAADGIHFVRAYCLKWIDLLAYLVPQPANG